MEQRKFNKPQSRNGPPKHFQRIRNRRNVNTIGVTSAYINGGKRNINSNPPPIAYQPWNHITLAFTEPSKDITIGHLVTLLKSQIDPTGKGLAASPAIQLKIHNVKVWNMVGHTIGLTVYDFIDNENSDQLVGIMDTGTPYQLPGIGYELPLTFRQHVIKNDNTTGKLKLLTTATPDTNPVLHHIRLLWKFDGPISFSMPNVTTLSTVNKSIQRTTKATVGVAQQLTDVVEHLKIISDRQPGLVSQIVGNAIQVVPMLTKETIDTIITTLREIELDTIDQEFLA